MKKNKILALVMVCFLGLVGCSSKGSVKKVLTSAEKNTEVKISGTISGVTTDGFYVFDGEEAIFVKDSTKVTLGNKVNVAGTYNGEFIKSTTSVKEGKAGESVTATETTVKAIKAMDETAKTGVFGKKVSLTATVIKNVAGQYTLVEDDGDYVYIASNSNKDINAKEDTRVTGEFIIAEKGSQTGWTVCYAGGKLEDNNWDSAKWISDSKERLASLVKPAAYGAYEVPSAHPVFPKQATYTWTSADDSLIKFNYDADNKLTGVTVNAEVPADKECKITATIKAGEATETVDYTVTVKYIALQTVKEFMNNIPEVNMSAVRIKGAVMGYSRNQSGSLYGIIVQDFEDPSCSTQVDVTKDQYESVSIGSEVTILGYYRTVESNDRPTIMNLIKFEVGGTKAVSYKEVYTVDSDAKMAELLNNWNKYCGKLVKFVNAKVVWNCTEAKKASTSYVIVGYDKTEYALNGKTATKACLVYSNNNSFTGTSYWADEMNIPFTGSTSVEYAATFYAVPSYYSSGTIAMLSMPCTDSFVPTDLVKNVEYHISAHVATSTMFEDISLPESVTVNGVEYKLTWNSSKPEVISNTGALTLQNEATDVNLIATFTVNGATKTYTRKISVGSTKTLTVSECVKNSADGAFVQVKGIVIGYHQAASQSTAGLKRTGYILMDSTTNEVIYVNGCYYIGGAYYDGFQASNGATIKIGDEISIVGCYHVNSANPGSKPSTAKNEDDFCIGRHYIDVESDLSKKYVTIISSGNTIAINDANCITVSSDAELAALVSNGIQYGKIIKITATAATPLYLRLGAKGTNISHTASTGANVAVSFQTVTKDAIKYPSKSGASEATLTFSLCAPMNNFGFEQLGLGNWYEKVGFTTASSSGQIEKVTGTVYCVLGYVNSTYYHLSIVDPSTCTLTK